jgi:hypothetical protein
MAEVVQDAQQEFWRSPTMLEPAVLPAAAPEMADACADCGIEFMIGARFCHTCGRRRPVRAAISTDAALAAGLWARSITWVQGWFPSSVLSGFRSSFQSSTGLIASSWQKVSVPGWLHYLHFHEIKRWIGLPTAALIAFMTGLGCVVGAISVGLFFRASNLAEFQAIQLWRIEWLLAATASFVAGILLKKPTDKDIDGEDSSSEDSNSD